MYVFARSKLQPPSEPCEIYAILSGFLNALNIMYYTTMLDSDWSQAVDTFSITVALSLSIILNHLF